MTITRAADRMVFGVGILTLAYMLAAFTMETRQFKLACRR